MFHGKASNSQSCFGAQCFVLANLRCSTWGGIPSCVHFMFISMLAYSCTRKASVQRSAQKRLAWSGHLEEDMKWTELRIPPLNCLTSINEEWACKVGMYVKRHLEAYTMADNWPATSLVEQTGKYCSWPDLRVRTHH